jgi:hypothetical protein
MNDTDKTLAELRKEIEAIELTEREKDMALFEGKLKKWNHERHRYYWEKQKGAYDGDKGPTTGQSF